MSCCGSEHATIIRAGEGISVLGTGTPTDPYYIASTILDLGQFFRVVDTATVNHTLTGSGTVEDPLTLRSAVTLGMTDLSDVDDPSGGPTAGEVPIFVGSGSNGHWEFQTPPPSPAGATNVINGLSGIGSAPDPVKIETSGVWGVGDLAGLGGDSTIGLAIYVDSNGDLRAEPVSAPAWASITGKPSTFTPSAHTHPVSQITDLSTNGNAARVNGIKPTYTPTSTTPPSSPSTGDWWIFPKGA